MKNEYYLGRKIVPVHVGSGTHIHAGYIVGTTTRSGRDVPEYQHVCGIGNTRNVNRRTSIKPAQAYRGELPAVTCSKCLACLAEDAERRAQIAAMVGGDCTPDTVAAAMADWRETQSAGWFHTATAANMAERLRSEIACRRAAAAEDAA